MKIDHVTRFVSTVLFVAVCSLHGAFAQSVEPCGFIGQAACSSPIVPTYANPDQQYLPAGTDEPGIECQRGAVAEGGTCVLDTSNLRSEPAKISAATDFAQLGIVPTANLNCPMYPSCLARPNGNNKKIPAGRYIYVLKSTDKLNPLVLRRFDRGDNPTLPCPGYRAFDTPDNYRLPGGAKHPTVYQYVRHPQLNGGYDPVYGAGELLVEPDNVVKSINNASGHFTPPNSSLTQVQAALYALGIKIAADFQKFDQAATPNLSPETCRTVQTIPAVGVVLFNHSQDEMVEYVADVYSSMGQSYYMWFDINGNPLLPNDSINEYFFRAAPHAKSVPIYAFRTSSPQYPAYSDINYGIPLSPYATHDWSGSSPHLQVTVNDMGMTSNGLRMKAVLWSANSDNIHRFCVTVDDPAAATPIFTVSEFQPGPGSKDDATVSQPCLRWIHLNYPSGSTSGT